VHFEATPQALIATSVEQLDATLLHLVFKRLGCQQLGRCACVNVAWSREAPLALTHVEWLIISDESVSKLENCLGRHAGHVQGLCVSMFRHRTVLLPWARSTQLQSISLCKMRIPEILPRPGAGGEGGYSGTSSSSSSSHQPLLPQLKQLELLHFNMHSERCLLLLASSSTLTSLKVSAGTTFGPPSLHQLTLAGTPHAGLLLEQLQQRGMLQQLAVLHLPGMLAESLELIPSMLSLQDLQLQLTVDVTTACLPQSLTRLKLNTKMGGLPRQMVSRLELSNLQQLHLHYCSVSPTVLKGVTQLQQLVLFDCHVHMVGVACMSFCHRCNMNE
jgi:hypothetical protein